MADVQSFFSQFTPTTYGVYALLGIVIVTLIKTWPAIKTKINAAKAADVGAYQSLLSRYEKRFAYLEESERRCQHDLADAMRRIAQLEGYDEGQGRARQEAADIVARERRRDRDGDGPK